MEPGTTILSQKVDGRQLTGQVRRWLEMRARAAPRDWAGMLAQLRDQLALTMAHPLLAHDREAQALVAAMLTASDMAEISAGVDLLGLRVAQLISENNARRGKPSRTQVMAQASGRSLRSLADGKNAETGTRTRLRL